VKELSKQDYKHIKNVMKKSAAMLERKADNYAIIDSSGLVSEGFRSENEVKDAYDALCEGGYEFYGTVMIVLIVETMNP
jgi:hypothetical protein